MKIAIAGTGHIGITNAILRAQHNEEVALGAVAGKRVASPFFYGVETRDINKAVSAKARQGKIANFTGIDSPYEAPETPEVTLNTIKLQPEQCVESLVQSMKVQSD